MLLLVLPAKKTASDSGDDPASFPEVTIIIPAFNEEDVIAETIKNKLDLDYPQDKLSIIVVSDESMDNTDTIVNDIAATDDRVKLIRQVPREGKTAGLNLAMKQCSSEIVVFCDANGIYDRGALQQLTAVFKDPDVGYVTGKMIYVNSEGNVIGDGCSAYMKYENILRELESKVSSVVGVDGGVDAIRREIYQPMRSDQLPDFVLPLKVIRQGYRVVYQSTALLKEKSLSNSQSEFSMRARVSLRAFWAMWDMKELFNPVAYRLFSVQLFSHKLLRYFAFAPIILVFLASLALIGEGGIYLLALVVQLVLYVVAWNGYKNQDSNNRLVALVYYFFLINAAAAYAFFNFLQGKKIALWKPRLG
ncbi:glycosyltransferase family 2 protein [Oceanicoccus sagamiensis]|uniref:glycosyltransferase family 2 protein n=1 Tax=Oceanicoccus sagamiensis TaxID=716816 RepID=UPI001F0B0C14|nr:glycosyltransferase family 2 protein [Oceanicoccus sagamiensis]